MKDRDLSFEIVKAVETGINKYLNRSITYSPFRLFYNLFKKSNPKLIEQVRATVRNDIENILQSITNFKPEFFIEGNAIRPKGIRLLQICHNIGFKLLKEKLTIITAFKALKNQQLRNEIYSYILGEIEEAVEYISITEIKA